MALLLPAGGAGAQSPLAKPIDVDVLGTNIHLQVRVGPSQRPVEPSQPGGPPPPRTTPTPSGDFDDQMAEISRLVPDFGGVFVDEGRHTLYVYMKGGLARAADSAARPRPIERVVHLLASRFMAAQQNVKVLRARYDFRRLDGWHRRMNVFLWRIPGVVRTGIDDRRNRLEVATSNREARRAVARELGRLRIPRQAVRLSVGRLGQPAATLQDRVRPMVGGQEINRGGFRCSLGVYGYSWLLRRWGFITNSHCTYFMATNDGTRQYQPAAFAAPGSPSNDWNDAGTEVNDPGWSGRCTHWVSTYPCRGSDSAFHAVPSWLDPDRSSAPRNTWQSWDRVWSHGTIALPSAPGAMNYDGWSLERSGFPSGARWIKAINFWPVKGTNVNKVGRTTGWTGGRVEKACDTALMDSGAGRPKHIITCAYDASFSVAGGDSGAPVFYGVEPTGEVVLAGLVFGEGGLFSPIGAIENELGTLYLCRMEYPGPTGPC